MTNFLRVCTSLLAAAAILLGLVPAAIIQAAEGTGFAVYLPLIHRTDPFNPIYPPVSPGFTAGGRPFRFLGAHVPSWSGGDPTFLDPAIYDDLVQTAKTSGLTVLTIYVPAFEYPAGNYNNETILIWLDYMLKTAGEHGVYVILKFGQGASMAGNSQDPYYHPGGIEGVIKDPVLKQHYLNRIAHIVTRTNTWTDVPYKDDPTIFGWFIIEEPISGPMNYPNRFPNVTPAELRGWLQEMAVFIKSMDPNHLVGINSPAGLAVVDDWFSAFDVPALDFFEAEDADLRILSIFPGTNPSQSAVRWLEKGKPVVAMLSFTSGLFDPAVLCSDLSLMMNYNRAAMLAYYQNEIAGITVYTWGSLLSAAGTSTSDQCYVYTPADTGMIQLFREASGWLNPAYFPAPPLNWIRVQN